MNKPSHSAQGERQAAVDAIQWARSIIIDHNNTSAIIKHINDCELSYLSKQFPETESTPSPHPNQWVDVSTPPEHEKCRCWFNVLNMGVYIGTYFADAGIFVSAEGTTVSKSLVTHYQVVEPPAPPTAENKDKQ